MRNLPVIAQFHMHICERPDSPLPHAFMINTRRGVDPLAPLSSAAVEDILSLILINFSASKLRNVYPSAPEPRPQRLSYVGVETFLCILFSENIFRSMRIVASAPLSSLRARVILRYVGEVRYLGPFMPDLSQDHMEPEAPADSSSPKDATFDTSFEAAFEAGRSLSREKPWQPKKWHPKYDIAVAMHMCGAKNQQVAAHLDLSESRVSVILNDPRAARIKKVYGSRIADKLGDIQTRLRAHASEALDEVVFQLRQSADEKIRQRAAFSILDRAGYSKVERKVSASVAISRDDVSHMKKVLDESEAIEGIDYAVVREEQQALPSPSANNDVGEEGTDDAE